MEALLGRGAMGSVYRAREVATGRAVALKVLQRVDDPRRRRRFEREARLAAAFDHPGIVKVHSAGTLQGIPYLACELIEGRELHTLYSEVSLERRVGWLRDAARALGHAHRRGIVHRDVKGANLLVDGEGRLRVVDFGVASARDVERLTRTGQWIGTPSHMAPEQFGGEALGPPCDVWALGVELYLAATGRLPFAAESPIELAGQVSKAACPRPRALSSEVSPELEAVILAALRPDAAERYPDGDALADDLDRLLAGERPRACGRRGRRVPLLAAGIFLSASLLGLLGAFGGAARSAEAARLAAVGQAAGAGAPA
ncbi:MAG: serine/threonine protein kinase, partial [Planctomycetota bacterium]